MSDEYGMLILSRREGERIVIGGDVIVSVERIDGGQVRIGIKAPKNVKVHREEIYERINGAVATTKAP